MPRSAENRPDRGQPAEAPKLEQPQAPEARVALAADHEVVVDRDAERSGGLGDLLGHFDVVARRLGVATGMVVQQATAQLTVLISLDFLTSQASIGDGDWGRFCVAVHDHPAASRSLSPSTFGSWWITWQRLLC